MQNIIRKSGFYSLLYYDFKKRLKTFKTYINQVCGM